MEVMNALSPEQSNRVIALAMDLAREGKTGELLEFLDHGLPIDAKDENGNTLLMLAAYHGHHDTVGSLIERGADVDLRNDRDQSPVAGALFKGENDVVKALVDAGISPDRITTNYYGDTKQVSEVPEENRVTICVTR